MSVGANFKIVEFIFNESFNGLWVVEEEWRTGESSFFKKQLVNISNTMNIIFTEFGSAVLEIQTFHFLLEKF